MVPSSAAAGGCHEHGSDQHLIPSAARYDHASEYDDEVLAVHDDVVKLDLHCDDRSGNQFAIFDIHEEEGEEEEEAKDDACRSSRSSRSSSPIRRISAAILATAPMSDAMISAEGDDDEEEEEDILPLSLSSTKPAQPRRKASRSQSPPRRKMHPRLPSQTTVCQRNEDTRP